MCAARNSLGVRQRTLYGAGTLPLACSARRALGVRRRVFPTHSARGESLLFSFQRTFVSALHATLAGLQYYTKFSMPFAPFPPSSSERTACCLSLYYTRTKFSTTLYVLYHGCRRS
jgi:hypothetical protein